MPKINRVVAIEVFGRACYRHLILWLILTVRNVTSAWPSLFIKYMNLFMNSKGRLKWISISMSSIWTGCFISRHCRLPHPEEVLQVPLCGPGQNASCQSSAENLSGSLSQTGSFHSWETPTVFLDAGLKYVWNVFCFVKCLKLNQPSWQISFFLLESPAAVILVGSQLSVCWVQCEFVLIWY